MDIPLLTIGLLAGWSATPWHLRWPIWPSLPWPWPPKPPCLCPIYASLAGMLSQPIIEYFWPAQLGLVSVIALGFVLGNIAVTVAIPANQRKTINAIP